MITNKSSKEEIITAVFESKTRLLELAARLSEDSINGVPYENSWTAAQLLQHIILSTDAMANALNSDTKPAEKGHPEKISMLKEVFLDSSNRLDSPEFIVPEKRNYPKLAIIGEMERSFEKFKLAAINADVDGLVKDLPLGPVTKLEILHFVLYHSQRHLRQMQRIHDTFNNQCQHSSAAEIVQ